MKKYKGFIIGGLVGASLMFSAQSFAAIGEKAEAIFSQFNFVINGQAKTLDESPVVINGNSYLPVRSISNALGYDVTYKADSRTIELNNGVGGANTSTKPQAQEVKPQAQVQGNKNIGEGVVYYLSSDVTKKYSPTSSRTLENGTVLWTINGKEIDQIQGMTDKDKYFVKETNDFYRSSQFYLKFLSEEQLREFQKYSIDFNTGKVTPIN